MSKPITLSKKKVNKNDFIKEILNDYKILCISREASLLGRKEVLTGKAKFGIFGDGKELAQIVMAKFFKNGDFRSGYYRDQTFSEKALEKLQEYIDDYPNSDNRIKAQEVILVLREKLSKKAYNSGLLYMKMEEYNAMREQKSGLDDSEQKLLADSEKEVKELEGGYQKNKDVCVQLLSNAVSSGLL